jgi:hypothetical protein
MELNNISVSVLRLLLADGTSHLAPLRELRALRSLEISRFDSNDYVCVSSIILNFIALLFWCDSGEMMLQMLMIQELVTAMVAGGTIEVDCSIYLLFMPQSIPLQF